MSDNTIRGIKFQCTQKAEEVFTPNKSAGDPESNKLSDGYCIAPPSLSGRNKSFLENLNIRARHILETSELTPSEGKAVDLLLRASVLAFGPFSSHVFSAGVVAVDDLSQLAHGLFSVFKQDAPKANQVPAEPLPPEGPKLTE